jgi:hypothetical protein
MTAKQSYFHLIFIGLTLLFVAGFDTTKTIYKSSISKNDYLKINALELTHCGCTELYADHYKNGKLAFQVFYNDRVFRKTIFDNTNNSKSPQTRSLLATTGENYTTPFDSLDLEIFRAIDSTKYRLKGFIYPLRLTQYKGYIADTLLNRY